MKGCRKRRGGPTDYFWLMSGAKTPARLRSRLPRRVLEGSADLDRSAYEGAWRSKEHQCCGSSAFFLQAKGRSKSMLRQRSVYGRLRRRPGHNDRERIGLRARSEAGLEGGRQEISYCFFGRLLPENAAVAALKRKAAAAQRPSRPTLGRPRSARQTTARI